LLRVARAACCSRGVLLARRTYRGHGRDIQLLDALVWKSISAREPLAGHLVRAAQRGLRG
jgi:hypothetical protein